MESTPNRDREQLKLLSIFHYVVGGIAACFSLISLPYIGIGAYMLSSPEEMRSTDGSSPPPEFGLLFLGTGIVLLIVFLSLAICQIISGRCLAKRKRYWFSIVVAGFECLFTPFGTILGILTIIVLVRVSVKSLYGISIQE
jgi:ABC-type branched-subunit amino acid transport system permease subunit